MAQQNNEAENGDVTKSNIRNLLKANIVFLAYHVAANIRMPPLNQYLYQRYIRQLGDNSTDILSVNFSSSCFVNKSSPEYQIHTQAEVMSNNLQVTFAYINNPLCAIVCLFLGSYSDFIGRRILFVLPLLGEAVRNALAVAVMFWHLPLWYLQLGAAINGFTGGFYGVMLASFVYSADNTPPHKSRTLAIAVVDFTSFFSAALSQVATGYFIQYTGFVWPSFTSAALTFVAAFLAAVILPETVSTKKKMLPCMKPLKAVKNVLGFYFSKDFGKKRTLFWIVVMVFFVNKMSSSGTAAIDYMLVLNQPFCWGPQKIGYYNTAYMLLKQFLGIGVIKVMHYCTNDDVIGIMTTGLQVLADLLHGLAYNDAMLYATIVIEGLSAGMFSVVIAILSRMAPADIQGSLFAGQIIISSISNAIGQGLSGVIYDDTLSVDRGIVYYVCGGTHVVGAALLGLYMWLAPNILNQMPKERIANQDMQVLPSEEINEEG